MGGGLYKLSSNTSMLEGANVRLGEVAKWEVILNVSDACTLGDCKDTVGVGGTSNRTWR